MKSWRKRLLILLFAAAVYGFFAISPKALALHFTDATNPPRTTVSIQCGEFTFTAEEDERVVRGIWAVGSQTRLERVDEMYLTRAGQPVTLVRTIGLSLPLHLPIQVGYVFGAYMHRPEMKTELAFTHPFEHYTQEWFMDPAEVDAATFKKLSECFFAHKKELETVLYDTQTVLGAPSGPSLPIRGIYLLEDAARWSKNHFDTSLHGDVKEFTCANGDTITVKDAEYIYGKNPLVIQQDGTITLAWFANGGHPETAVVSDLSSCHDENGNLLTEFYKTRAARISPLY